MKSAARKAPTPAGYAIELQPGVYVAITWHLPVGSDDPLRDGWRPFRWTRGLAEAEIFVSEDAALKFAGAAVKHTQYQVQPITDDDLFDAGMSHRW